MLAVDDWPVWPLGEQDLVDVWRELVLERAGFPLAIAIDLAQERTVDLHQALGLLEAGCPPELVARILL